MNFNKNKTYKAPHTAPKKAQRTGWETFVRWSKITGATAGAIGVVATVGLTKYAIKEHNTVDALRTQNETSQLLDEQLTPDLSKKYQKSLPNPNATAEDVVTQANSSNDYSLNYEVTIPNGQTLDVTGSTVVVKNGNAQISGGHADFVPSGSTLKLSGHF